ncbi:V8-like Glu-specific endopeptidase [Streptomyces sp. 2333.5]|nr:V8-like Glu-specific endopeptidase [Streptomyces sp. 2333.5]SEC80663.1 V8-like Glu-specific endopeptidase [Streptomyces sp. 2314.4]SED66042.1 V8-like Glu-specific endopeptidase [Streptomyces sp. 2112.2]
MQGDHTGNHEMTRAEQRRRNRRWRRGATAALGLAVCLAAAPFGHAVDGARHEAPKAKSPATDAGWTSRDAAAYWTAERMAAAAPAGPNSQGSAMTARSAPTAGQRAATARHFDGIPSVGVLFSVDGDARAHHCTASVVHSPHGNLILTAGHCNPGSRAAFVPQYRSGATTQPYGVWAIDDTFAYPGRGTTGDGADLDFAFATVAADDDGRRIEDVTGGNTLTPTPGYGNDVTVIGYPNVRNDPADRAVRCATRTERLTGTRELRMSCGGFYGGTSGSPWLTDYDEQSHTGRVIGLIGGLNGGGPKGPDNDRTSYSPYFGTKILSLYARATQG